MLLQLTTDEERSASAQTSGIENGSIWIRNETERNRDNGIPGVTQIVFGIKPINNCNPGTQIPTNDFFKLWQYQSQNIGVLSSNCNWKISYRNGIGRCLISAQIRGDATPNDGIANTDILGSFTTDGANTDGSFILSGIGGNNALQYNGGAVRWLDFTVSDTCPSQLTSSVTLQNITAANDINPVAVLVVANLRVVNDCDTGIRPPTKSSFSLHAGTSDDTGVLSRNCDWEVTFRSGNYLCEVSAQVVGDATPNDQTITTDDNLGNPVTDGLLGFSGTDSIAALRYNGGEVTGIEFTVTENCISNENTPITLRNLTPPNRANPINSQVIVGIQVLNDCNPGELEPTSSSLTLDAGASVNTDLLSPNCNWEVTFRNSNGLCGVNAQVNTARNANIGTEVDGSMILSGTGDSDRLQYAGVSVLDIEFSVTSNCSQQINAPIILTNLAARDFGNFTANQVLIGIRTVNNCDPGDQIPTSSFHRLSAYTTMDTGILSSNCNWEILFRSSEDSCSFSAQVIGDLNPTDGDIITRYNIASTERDGLLLLAGIGNNRKLQYNGVGAFEIDFIPDFPCSQESAQRPINGDSGIPIPPTSPAINLGGGINDGVRGTISATSISSDMAGTYMVTVNGTDWQGAPDGLFVTVCSGAQGGDWATITPANAVSVCPTLLDDTGRGNPGNTDSFTYQFSVEITDGDIANGQVAVLAGWLSAGSGWFAGTNILIGNPSTTIPPPEPPTEASGNGNGDPANSAPTSSAPANEDETISVIPSSIPGIAGDYIVSVRGAGWLGAPDGLFVTICSKANGGDSSTITATNVLSACPTLIVDSGRGNPSGTDTFTYSLSITVSEDDIANGKIAILAGEFAAGSPWSAGTNLVLDPYFSPGVSISVPQLDADRDGDNDFSGRRFVVTFRRVFGSEAGCTASASRSYVVQDSGTVTGSDPSLVDRPAGVTSGCSYAIFWPTVAGLVRQSGATATVSSSAKSASASYRATAATSFTPDVTITVPQLDVDGNGGNDFSGRRFVVTFRRVFGSNSGCTALASRLYVVQDSGTVTGSDPSLVDRPAGVTSGCSYAISWPAVAGLVRQSGAAVSVSALSKLASASYRATAASSFSPDVTITVPHLDADGDGDNDFSGVRLVVSFRRELGSDAGCTISASRTYVVQPSGSVSGSDPSLVDRPVGVTSSCVYMITWPTVAGLIKQDGATATVNSSEKLASASYDATTETSFTPSVMIYVSRTDSDGDGANDFSGTNFGVTFRRELGSEAGCTASASRTYVVQDSGTVTGSNPDLVDRPAGVITGCSYTISWPVVAGLAIQSGATASVSSSAKIATANYDLPAASQVPQDDAGSAGSTAGISSGTSGGNSRAGSAGGQIGNSGASDSVEIGGGSEANTGDDSDLAGEVPIEPPEVSVGERDMSRGWTILRFNGQSGTTPAAFASALSDSVNSIWVWDPQTQGWSGWSASGRVATLASLSQGDLVMAYVPRTRTIAYSPSDLLDLPAASGSLTLPPLYSVQMFGGQTTAKLSELLTAAVGLVPVIFRWNSQDQEWNYHLPGYGPVPSVAVPWFDKISPGDTVFIFNATGQNTTIAWL